MCSRLYIRPTEAARQLFAIDSASRSRLRLHVPEFIEPNFPKINTFITFTIRAISAQQTGYRLKEKLGERHIKFLLPLDGYDKLPTEIRTISCVASLFLQRLFSPYLHVTFYLYFDLRIMLIR